MQQNTAGGKEGESGVGKEVMVAPREKGREEEEVVDVTAPKKDTRPAGADGWSFRARNSLMFSPGADVSPYDQEHARKRTSKDDQAWKHPTRGTRRKTILLSI
jgi:protein DGCR14